MVVYYATTKLFKDKKPRDMTKGFILPLSIASYVTSKFGKRAIGYHNGIDLHAPMKTPVFAPMDGTVNLSTSKDGGNQIVIVHPNGYKTGYAHLSEWKVKNKEVVKQGQLIALSGNTGGHTTAPHLHLTVTDNRGIKIDPMKVFDFKLKT